ncbi:MAG: DMT family transporter [Nonomuraea sp.]|nr:DMT family transporter [Nonomuraea sp.]
MSRRGWVLFALISVMWGIPYLLIKVAVAEVPVPVLVFARTAIGAALLLPLALRGGQLPLVRRFWRPVAVFACLEILAPWWLISDAERRLSSSTSGLLIAAAPILGVVLARMSGGSERLGRVRWIGLGLGLAGVAVLAGPHLGSGDAWAIGEMVLTALCYSLAPIVATRYLEDLPSLPLTATCLAFAALVYTPAAIWTWPSTMPSAQALGALVGLGVVCTGLALVVFLELIREVGSSRALVSVYVNPAVAIVAGVLILDEPLTALILASFVLILTGCALATRTEEAAERSAEAEVPLDSRAG